ncbi:30S ribosomal protein S17 [bacterium]|nr:30S ribosomal protein S17 [bacterium]MBD5405126.1 30S ribosomal protein S17 [bacterium]
MPRRILEGNVVSTKMDKTIVVEVERRYMHPLYKKFIRTTKKYHAHNVDSSIKEGDTVKIRETKPMSKTKTWEVFTEGNK